jgi:hypothetical protein
MNAATEDKQRQTSPTFAKLPSHFFEAKRELSEQKNVTILPKNSAKKCYEILHELHKPSATTSQDTATTSQDTATTSQDTA